MSGRVRIEFEEVIERRVTVNCTDAQVAREIWENEDRAHIREGWVAESARFNSFVDWDSASFYPVTEPGLV